MNKKLVNGIKYFTFFLIGVALIFLVFKDIDLVKMINDLKKADYVWIIPSFVMGYAAYVSRAYRWLILLKPMGYKPKVINSINSVTITYFTNLAFPRAGEVARATSLNQSEGIPIDKLLGTIVIERIIDMLLLLLLIFATVILRYDDLLNFYNTAVASGGSGKGSFDSNSLLIVAIVLATAIVVIYLFRKKIKSTVVYGKFKTFMLGIKEGISTVKHMDDKFMFIVHTLFIWVMYYFMVYIVFFAVPETSNLTILDGLFIMAVGALGMVAPVPGGLGAYHGAVMIGLGLLGIEKETALSFAVIVHSTQTLIALIFGPIAVVMSSFAKKKQIK